jgi:hypothetical protein
MSLGKKVVWATVHRKMRLIESNAKSCHLKNWPVKELWGRCLSVGGPEPHTPPPYTLYTSIQYTYSYRERGKGGELYQREGEMGNSSQSCVEKTNMTNQSINSDKHLPQSPLKGMFGPYWSHFLSRKSLTASQEWNEREIEGAWRCESGQQTSCLHVLIKASQIA